MYLNNRSYSQSQSGEEKRKQQYHQKASGRKYNTTNREAAPHNRHRNVGKPGDDPKIGIVSMG
jgi:hypothetical protein